MRKTSLTLFVRSIQSELPSAPVFVDGLGSGPRLVPGKSKLARLSPQDALAERLLKQSGVPFELIDISKGLRAKFGARRNGITETPTLVNNNATNERYVGFQTISQYLAQRRPATGT